VDAVIAPPAIRPLFAVAATGATDAVLRLAQSTVLPASRGRRRSSSRRTSPEHGRVTGACGPDHAPCASRWCACLAIDRPRHPVIGIVAFRDPLEDRCPVGPSVGVRSVSRSRPVRGDPAAAGDDRHRRLRPPDARQLSHSSWS
jgi:hypothetical protein